MLLIDSVDTADQDLKECKSRRAVYPICIMDDLSSNSDLNFIYFPKLYCCIQKVLCAVFVVFKLDEVTHVRTIPP